MVLAYIHENMEFYSTLGEDFREFQIAVFGKILYFFCL